MVISITVGCDDSSPCLTVSSQSLDSQAFFMVTSSTCRLAVGSHDFDSQGGSTSLALRVQYRRSSKVVNIAEDRLKWVESEQNLREHSRRKQTATELGISGGANRFLEVLVLIPSKVTHLNLSHSSHNFNSRDFRLRVSYPMSKYIVTPY